MKCHQARELASEALDGALAAAPAEEFRTHLAGCPPCRGFYAELRESLTLLSELPEVEVDGRFDEAVWARLREDAPRRAAAWDGFRVWKEKLALAGVQSGFGGAWRWAPLGAAAALLTFFALSSGPGFDAELSGGFASRSTPPASTPVTFAPPAETNEKDVLVSQLESADEALASMPEAIEAYLRSTSRDLRLETNGERLRRANYSYPIRRVGDWGVVREGPVGGSTPAVQVRPVSDPGAAVIAF